MQEPIFKIKDKEYNSQDYFPVLLMNFSLNIHKGAYVDIL